MARGAKFCIYEEEVLYYPSSKNKGADQLCSYREVDLRLCFRMCKHAGAQLKYTKGPLDLGVLFTPFTPKRQNINQVEQNSCTLVYSSFQGGVVGTVLSRDNNKMAD